MSQVQARAVPQTAGKWKPEIIVFWTLLRPHKRRKLEFHDRCQSKIRHRAQATD
jgi:hypothetical protein